MYGVRACEAECYDDQAIFFVVANQNWFLFGQLASKSYSFIDIDLTRVMPVRHARESGQGRSNLY